MFSLVNSETNISDATYNLLQGLNADGTDDPTKGALLDIDNLINYMISHLYAGPEDWPHHNWYAGRAEGPDSEGYQFFTWDQEIVLDGRLRDRTEINNDFTPARLYNKLRTNDQFKQRFTDLIQMHLFNDGALTVEASQARWDARSNEIEAAIIAESARWGDAREGEQIVVDSGDAPVTVPTLTVDHWRAENLNVRNNYFQEHFDAFISRMIADGLFSAVEAPVFNQHGGDVTADFDLKMNITGLGDVYYTTDGSDPMDGGSPSANAQLYTGPINLAQSGMVLTRTLDNGVWSGLNKAFFTVDNLLRITEIHYNPDAK